MLEQTIVSAMFEEVATIETEIIDLRNQITDMQQRLTERQTLQAAMWTVLGHYEKQEPRTEYLEQEQIDDLLLENTPVTVAVSSDTSMTVTDRLVMLVGAIGEPFLPEQAERALSETGYPIRGKRPVTVVAGILARSPRFIRNEQGQYLLANRG